MPFGTLPRHTYRRALVLLLLVFADQAAARTRFPGDQLAPAFYPAAYNLHVPVRHERRSISKIARLMLRGCCRAVCCFTRSPAS